MIPALLRTIIFSLLTGCLPAIQALALASPVYPVIKRKFNLPPSAELRYTIAARQSGLTIEGGAVVQWESLDNKYLITTEARVMLIGKILDAKSEGVIDDYGLAPVAFTEKRLHKDTTTTAFDHQTHTISFSASTDIYPIKGGEQDRNSVIWQLIAIARAATGKIKVGSEWIFFVAGQHDAELWRFRAIKQERIATPLGDMNTFHIVKIPRLDAKTQRLDIWLAPSFEWYPVRLRFIDVDGDYIEQSLQQMKKRGV